MSDMREMNMPNSSREEKLTLGVILVAFNSSDVIIDALETLFAAAQVDDVSLRVAVVDNDSPDETCALIEGWETGAVPYAQPDDLPFDMPETVAKPLPTGALQVIKAGFNGGFAAGVNLGLDALFGDPEIERVWILNPDTVVPPGTVGAFAKPQSGAFSLMGGRVLYYDKPGMIQTDGGTLTWQTGVTHNCNLFSSSDVAPPRAEALEFIMGGSMVASRDFWEQTGPMLEDYFLYYEEVDWALRRGNLPLVYCADAIVYHKAGTAIGSPAPGRPASPFSIYFKHRARMMFLRRHAARNILWGWAYTLAKAGQLLLKGYPLEARAALAGAWGARPPQIVADRLGPKVMARVFGR